MEPYAGRPATERTEVWLSYDQRNIYVSFRAWESEPSRAVANEMRRDSGNIRQGDCIGFSFDTFHDRRNAVQFEINPLGGRTDGQSTNERQYNADWNPVWDMAVGKFDGGWTVEVSVPFKSLRYTPGREQVWGFQARRNNKWKNEISYLTAVPPSLGIGRGSFSASLYASAGGFEAPPQALNLEIKPYVISDLSTDRTATPVVQNDPGADAGLDVKYALTQGLTADLTYNTDFAQVEADEQQVNLTRFNLFFPEKREFFLENIGLFSFGGAGGTTTTGDAGDTPILFYSRRIGLNGSRSVPILAGGRVTGRIGRYTIGGVNIQTRADSRAPTPSTNFLMLRARRDILRRSSVGVIASNRSVTQSGIGENRVLGVDGAFAFFNNLSFNTYLAQSATTGRSGDDVSYRAQMEYTGDRYGVQAERLAIGANFNPEIGYVRRFDMRKNYGQFRFSPRSTAVKAVRKFSSIGTVTRVANGTGRLESRLFDGEFAVELQNSDRFAVGAANDYEFLARPFPIAGTSVSIAPGAYHFTTGRVGYLFGQQRPVSGNLLIERGTFYSGERTAFTFNRSRVNLSARFSVEPSLSVNRVHLREGNFTTTVVGSRLTYTMTPLMFVSALMQYNATAASMSANVRFRWVYRPGSELFLVFNEDRDTLAPGFPDTRNRSIVAKMTAWTRL